VSDPILSAEDVWVRVTPRGGHEPVAVVRGASFAIERGSQTCIVGESGSGKTILMRSILGISSARPGVTGGQAWFHPAGAAQPRAALESAGRRSRRSLHRLRQGWAGYVFQHPIEALDPFRTVGAQVLDSVRVARHDVSRYEQGRKAIEWLDAVRLPDPAGVARLHPHELSGGMAQRVAIAVALGTEPEFLVADEPTTGLDWSVRREIVELLGALCRERGMTLVLISHDFQVVERMAERVIVMYRGELLEDGPREAFFPGPGAHPYTAELQGRVRELEEGRGGDAERGPNAPEGDDGCRFVHRCSRAVEACGHGTPADVSAGDGHRVRCPVIGGAS